jgi:hypothetical protein
VRGNKGNKDEPPCGELTLSVRYPSFTDPLVCPHLPLTATSLGSQEEYLLFEEEATFLLKLAERVKATSISGTSTTTCGLCTKPKPLCTPTCSRRSKTSRVPPPSGPPCKRCRIHRVSPTQPRGGERSQGVPASSRRKQKQKLHTFTDEVTLSTN